MTSAWQEHPELVDEMRTLLAEGLSFGQVAQRLGHGLTRNACLGKAMRLGIPHRGPLMQTKTRATPFLLPSQHGRGQKPPQRQAPRKIPADADAPAPLVDGGGNPITMANVETAHCRFVHGEGPTFRFCGRQKRGSTFCEYHEGKCYQPSHMNGGKSA